MKPTNPQPNGHYHLQKWGLFVLLAGSLGFNLSMNPDHFNNIARNEGGAGFFDMASKSYEDLIKERDVKIKEELKRLKATDPKLTDAKIELVMKELEEYHKNKLPSGNDDIQAALRKAGYTAEDSEKLFKQIKPDIAAMPKKEKSVTKAAPCTETQPRNPADKDSKKEDKPCSTDNKESKAHADNVKAMQKQAQAETKKMDDAKAEALKKAEQAKATSAGSDSSSEGRKNEDVQLFTKKELQKMISETVKEAMMKEQRKDAITQNALLPAEAQAQPVANSASPAPAANAAAQPAPSNGNPEAATPNAAANPKTPPVAGTAPNETVPKGFQYDLSATKGYCTYSVEIENGKTTVSAKKATTAKACHLDGQKKSLTSNIDKIADVKDEVFAWAEGKAEGDKEETKEKSQKELAKEFWDKETKRCKGKKIEADERMECYKEALTKLSNDVLDDSAQSKNIVKQYFLSSLAPMLKVQMSMPTTTIDPITGIPTVNTSMLESADQTAKELLSDLSGSNSQEVIATLSKMKASSWSVQTGYAREMYMTSQQEKASSDMSTKLLGMRREEIAKRLLNPAGLKWQMMRERSEWGNALNSDSMFGQIELNRSFAQPVQSFLSKLPTIEDYNSVGAGQQTKAALALAQLSLPGDASGLGMNSVNSDNYGSSWTPGWSGLSSFPIGLLDSRQNYNRGRNLPAVGPVTATAANKITTIPTSGRTGNNSPRLRSGVLTDDIY